MVFFRAGIALIAGAFMTIHAVAADVSGQARNWTGFSVGVSGGYHAGDITQSGCVGSCLVNPKLNKIFVALEGGYDHQFANNMVLGVMAIIPVTEFDKTLVTTPTPFSFDVDPKFAFAIAMRLGYAVNDLLPYAVVGFQFSHLQVTSGPTKVSHDHYGVVLGGGVEFALDDNWSLDAKYMFVHSPRVSYDFGGGPSKYGENAHNIMFGVKFKIH